MEVIQEAKQRTIQEAYGDYWELFSNSSKQCALNNNGWINITLEDKPNNLELEFREKFIYRPKSLQGIENNNGWIRIESEDDLPKEEGDYLPYHNLNYPKTTETFSKNVIKKLFEYNKITHYKKLKPEKPPIY